MLLVIFVFFATTRTLACKSSCYTDPSPKTFVNHKMKTLQN